MEIIKSQGLFLNTLYMKQTSIYGVIYLTNMKKYTFYIISIILSLAATNASSNEVIIKNVPEMRMAKLPTDSNSPAFWKDDKLYWYGSHGRIWISGGNNMFDAKYIKDVDFVYSSNPRPVWMESIHVEDDTIFGWYHMEFFDQIPNSNLSIPKVGATISTDGSVVKDIGIILESSYPVDPNAGNGYFAGGHGDFSVILDRDKKYFYFLFDNYSGDISDQGVCIARMAYEDRHNPIGKVYKFYNGAWNENGLGGKVTPLFKVFRSWSYADPDAFWGPAVHWNTYLNCYVMLLNRAQGRPGWSQEGVYISFNKDISNPYGWSNPKKILDKTQFDGWYFFYPQVMGLKHGETDREVGSVARLFVAGISRWEIEFVKNEITNVSTRGYVDQTKSIIKGFSINKSGKKQMLIRAVGPSLSQFGISQYLHNPRIYLFDSSGKMIAENDDWNNSISSKFGKVGAFPLLPNSMDAAMVVDLNGSTTYTVQASSQNQQGGEVLIEIYEMP